MFRYSSFGLSIQSELELPDLLPGEGQPDVAIRLGSVSRVSRRATQDEEFAFNTHAGAFQINRGREIVIDPLPGGDPAALRTVLMGKMMALILRQRGWLPLHASGVAIGGTVVLFLGASGSGKSTTAAAFHSFGHRVIADDIAAVRVEGRDCLVRSAGARTRLLDDSRTILNGKEPPGGLRGDKYAVDLSRGKLEALLPVQRIYTLEFGPNLQTSLIPPLSAFAQLSEYSLIKRHRLGPEALDAHIRDCTSVANAVPVYRLVRPRSFSSLAALVHSVEENVAAHE